MAAVKLGLAEINEILFEVFPEDTLPQYALMDKPLFGLLEKDEHMGGDSYNIPIWHGDVRSVGHDLPSVIANSETTKQAKFVLDEDDFNETYGVSTIKGKALLGTRSKMYSFLQAREMQVGSMLSQLGELMQFELYRDGTGARGQIKTVNFGANKKVIELTNKTDVYNFGEGQTLVATADLVTIKQSSSVDNIAKVTHLDQEAGTITIDVDYDSFAANDWANNDYLLTQGDLNKGAKGLAAWLPVSTSGLATPFLGQARNKNVARLAGHRVDKPGRTIEENCAELARKIGMAGGKPNTILMHPVAGEVFAAQVGTKVDRINVEGAENVKVGFSGFTVYHFTVGPMKVVFDWACPLDRGYMLQPNTWKIVHMGALPHIVADDGQMAARGSNSDDIQIRGRAFNNLACMYPGANGVFTISVS